MDNFGQQSDWVEIRNIHTSPVNLAGYYLSNDRNNRYKWKFPAGFTMGVNTYSVVWLTGKNTVVNGNYHANFTLDQCKNQWLMLCAPDGALRDSVFVVKTKAGHSWGRVDSTILGLNGWRLYTSHSFMYANPNVNNYLGYVKKPVMETYPAPNPYTSTAKVNAGGFVDPATTVYFKDGALRYDTAFRPCYNIYYTLNGQYPVVGTPWTFQVFDSTNPVITVDQATIVRAIGVMNPTNTACQQGYLPSFCETNTYFAADAYHNFDINFGVVSLAIPDTGWFYSNGIPANNLCHIEYYDKKMQVCEGYGLMNRPENETWLTPQKGFNVTIDDRQGFGCNFEGNIFNVEGLGVSSRTVFPTLQLYAGDMESHSQYFATSTPTSVGTGLRDVFMQSLAAKYDLHVNPLHVKPVIVFRNGLYQGVYTFKETYDKFYENYYNHLSKDSLDLSYYHNTDGYIAFPPDGSISRFSPISSFKTGVYNIGTASTIHNSATAYKSFTTALDIPSFTDYMILNSYAQNSNLWNYDIAYARGNQPNQGSTKWHYYLWNMPAIFNFTAIATNNLVYSNAATPLCAIYSNSYALSPVTAGNGHGAILRTLMNPSIGNGTFQAQYLNRLQDLLNSALKCDNILAHFDYIWNLYGPEMRNHENPGYVGQGPFRTAEGVWDTNMYHLRRTIEQRCTYVAYSLKTAGCYDMKGPYDIIVNVEPPGSGKVRLNSIELESNPWYGNYYRESPMGFKAIPTNTTFAFHHWEFKNSLILNNNPLSRDTIAVGFSGQDEVTAVFTDKSRDLGFSGDSPNVPTGFTPNGDGRNDTFGPLGSAYFTSNYEMTIWDRWGEEVFRSLSPTEQWDGNYKGQQAMTGVYAYIIKYKNIYGEDKLLKGNVTLTR